MNCPHCSSENTIKYGIDTLKIGIKVQRYKCKNCRKQFNERTGTPMSRLRNSSKKVALAIKMRTEGTGLRAVGRNLDRSHSTIIYWEQRLVNVEKQWSPNAPENGDITLEGDELYTRVKKT